MCGVAGFEGGAVCVCVWWKLLAGSFACKELAVSVCWWYRHLRFYTCQYSSPCFNLKSVISLMPYTNHSYLWQKVIYHIFLNSLKHGATITRVITSFDVGGGDSTELHFGHAVALCYSSLHCPKSMWGDTINCQCPGFGIMAPSEARKGDSGFKMLNTVRRKARVKHWIALLIHTLSWQDIIELIIREQSLNGKGSLR